VRDWWYKKIFNKNWGAEFRARFYLKSQGLGLTKQSIHERVLEEREAWHVGRVGLKDDLDHNHNGGLLELRSIVTGFTMDQLKAAFEDGREACDFLVMKPVELTFVIGIMGCRHRVREI
jgi:hypothetical protein